MSPSRESNASFPSRSPTRPSDVVAGSRRSKRKVATKLFHDEIYSPSPSPKKKKRRVSNNKKKKSPPKEKEKEGLSNAEVADRLNDLEAEHEGRIPTDFFPLDSKGKRKYGKGHHQCRRTTASYFFKHVYRSPDEDSGLWHGKSGIITRIRKKLHLPSTGGTRRAIAYHTQVQCNEAGVCRS